MPPRTQFTSDDVLEAAFEIVREEGLKKLSARRVAEKLNSSTAPVYSSFRSMTELEGAVIRKAVDLLEEYTKKEYTDIPFLNMGVGFVVFARDHDMLFRSLFLEGNRFKNVVCDFHTSLEERLPKVSILEGLDEDEKKLVLKKLSTYSIGLATLVCTGLLDDDSDELIIYAMNSMGIDIIGAAMGKVGICNKK